MRTITTTDARKDIIEIRMNMTTPGITTGEGMIEDKETGISDTTKGEGIFSGKSVGKQLENTTRDKAQTPR